MAILFDKKATYVNIVETDTNPDTPLMSFPLNSVILKVANVATEEIQITNNDVRMWGFFRSQLDASQQGTSLLNCVDVLMTACTA